jgi:hypothetical protein
VAAILALYFCPLEKLLLKELGQGDPVLGHLIILLLHDEPKPAGFAINQINLRVGADQVHQSQIGLVAAPQD